MSILTSNSKQAEAEDWFTEFFGLNELPLVEWESVLTHIQNLRPVEQNQVRRQLDRVADPVPYLQYLRDGIAKEGLVI